ncbi:MAG: ABC transporter permease [Chitinophagaceae bacterium]|nr:MAG: ABC transporter permease [Chitinophagaceae bacterium]
MMLPLVPDIAASLLRARLRQTLVAAVGVTFSITMFITLLSFMTGLNKMLDGLVVNRTPHVRLYKDVRPSGQQPLALAPQYKGSYVFLSSVKAGNARQELYNSGAILQAVKAEPRVRGAAPRINAPIFFNNGAIDISAVLYGIRAEDEVRLFHFNEYVVEGRPQDLDNVANSIILGKALADKLQVHVGDVVPVTTARGDQFPLKVVGLFQSGVTDWDKVQSYADLATTQKVLGKPASYVTDINVKLFDIADAPALAKDFAARFGTDAEDIQSANAQFDTGTNIRNLISYVVGIVLLTVAGFGIYNILNMMIYEKMDAIAILKATGFTGGDVRRIFLYIALSIGFFGGLAGLLFGFVLSAIIDHIPFNTAALPTVHTYPINYNPLYYFIASAFSLLTTYLAGFFPARKASRVDPVQIIRGK